MRRNGWNAGSARATYGRSDAQDADHQGGAGAPARVGPSNGPSIDSLPVLLTMAEVAAMLRTSRKAIYAMAERRQLPGLTRIGRRLLVRRDDLLSWLDERRAASPGGTRR
jgi:excisionase family DNA binding protein